MSSEAVHPDPMALERDLLRCEVLNPLTVILIRTQFLQRITQQTPGLNDLERTALLNGLAAILASAHELGVGLELAIVQDANPATHTQPVPITPPPEVLHQAPSTESSTRPVDPSARLCPGRFLETINRDLPASTASSSPPRGWCRSSTSCPAPGTTIAANPSPGACFRRSFV
jgi:hypothetical protein